MGRETWDRYPTMEAMADDLRPFLEHRVVRAYETGAWAELKTWVRRNRDLAWTVGLALVLAVAGGAWSYVTIRGERDIAFANEQLARTNEQRALDRERKVRRLSDARRLRDCSRRGSPSGRGIPRRSTRSRSGSAMRTHWPPVCPSTSRRCGIFGSWGRLSRSPQASTATRW